MFCPLISVLALYFLHLLFHSCPCLHLPFQSCPCPPLPCPCPLALALTLPPAFQDEATRLTAMTWIKDFVEMANGKLVEQYPSILGTVLANISHQNRDIVQVQGVESG